MNIAEDTDRALRVRRNGRFYTFDESIYRKRKQKKFTKNHPTQITLYCPLKSKRMDELNLKNGGFFGRFFPLC